MASPDPAATGIEGSQRTTIQPRRIVIVDQPHCGPP